MVNFMLCIFYYPEIFIEFHFFKKREKRKEEETQRGGGCDDEAEAGEMRLQAEALRERREKGTGQMASEPRNQPAPSSFRLLASRSLWQFVTTQSWETNP